MDIGAGLEIIPRAGNIPVGSVVVPGVPAVSLGNKFTVSQKSFIGPRGMFQFTRKNMRGRAETATLGLDWGRDSISERHSPMPIPTYTERPGHRYFRCPVNARRKTQSTPD